MATTETLEYQDDEYHVILTLRRATVKQGITRSTLINEALLEARQQQRGKTPDPATLGESIIRTYTYPSCVAALVKVENKSVKGKPPAMKVPDEPTFEEFLDLPDGLAFQWEELAMKLNPHWAPRFPEETEEGKEPPPSEQPGEQRSTT